MEDRVRTYKEQGERISASMANIKHKIVILSGKGGVGKSTITANLAIALVKKGHAGRVGILDADITDPSMPKILGLGRRPLSPGARGILPPTTPSGVKVISMDLLLRDEDTPVAWREPLRSTEPKLKFSGGGGERIASDLRVSFLGNIPLDPRICEGSDLGLPFLVDHQDSAAAKAFASVVNGIEEFLLKRSAS